MSTTEGAPAANPPEPWPTELRLLKGGRTLRVAFDSGEAFNLPAELLRVRSPSAAVRGHGPADRKLVAGKRAVAIRAVEPVGSYAARLVFDDGHDTGLYTWPLLLRFGREGAAMMAEYEAELAAAGQSRER